MRALGFVVTVMLLAGCSTAVPVTARFPEPPGKLATTPCPPLNKLKDTVNISDVSRTVTNNYSLYYECQVKNDTWNEWYQIQRQLFERAQK